MPDEAGGDVNLKSEIPSGDYDGYKRLALGTDCARRVR